MGWFKTVFLTQTFASSRSYTTLEAIFVHYTASHQTVKPLPVLPKAPLLRPRRLSGDQLSEIKSDTDKTDTLPAPIPAIQMDESSGFPFKITSVTTQPEEEQSPSQPQQQQHEFPFAIANVMSLADQQKEPSPRPLPSSPPPLSPLPPALPASSKKPTTHKVVLKDVPVVKTANTSKKSPEAVAVMLQLQNLVNLYKCPEYFCSYSTNNRCSFQHHLKIHSAFTKESALIPCMYCDYGNSLEHVVIHVDARHGKCMFCCPWCFYRALTKTYVNCHMMDRHPEKSGGTVIRVGLNPQAQNVKVPLVMPSLRELMRECLYECPVYGESSFCLRHVTCPGSLICRRLQRPISYCQGVRLPPEDAQGTGTPGLSQKTVLVQVTVCFLSVYGTLQLPPSRFRYDVKQDTLYHMKRTSSFLNHYQKEHNIRMYMCRYCPTGFSLLPNAYMHLSETHPANPIDVIYREYVTADPVHANVNSEATYEQLRRITKEPPEDKTNVGGKNNQTQRHQKEGASKALVLNHFLGQKESLSLVSSMFDEPMVAIEERETTDCDPLSLEAGGVIEEFTLNSR